MGILTGMAVFERKMVLKPTYDISDTLSMSSPHSKISGKDHFIKRSCQAKLFFYNSGSFSKVKFGIKFFVMNP